MPRKAVQMHTCVYSGNRMRQEMSLLHIKANIGDRRVSGGTMKSAG